MGWGTNVSIWERGRLSGGVSLELAPGVPTDLNPRR